MTAMNLTVSDARELTVEELDAVSGAIGLPGAIGGGILGFASGVTTAVASGGTFGDAVVGGVLGAGAGAFMGGTGNYIGLVGMTFSPVGGVAHRIASDQIDNMVSG